MNIKPHFPWVTVLALILVQISCNLPQKPVPTLVPTVHLPAVQPTDFQPLPSSIATLTPQPVAPTAAPEPTYQPVFEPSACAFPVPVGYSPDCGYLVIPENRSVEGGRVIRLHVAIFRSRAAVPAPDPVVYLSGGPGSSALELAGYVLRSGLDQALERSDLILFDQRGTGYSIPRLDCSERQDLVPILLENRPPPEEEAQSVTDAFRRCRERLQAEGWNLSAYHSAASAADVNDLRLALGIEQINLYAVSYGTRLGLTVMRDFPTALRSAVLDSVLPLEVNLYTGLAPNAERAFNRLFELCAAAPGCSAAYPDLKNVFYELVDQLEQAPFPVTVYDGQQNRIVQVDGGLLIDVLFVGMYNPQVTALMPRMIYDIRRGEAGILRDRLELYFDRSSALGMTISVQCAEEIPFSRIEDAYTSAQNIQPQIAGFFPASIAGLFAACPDWNPGPHDPRENMPIQSGVPSLLLSGDFDPITPPDWARQASTHLAQSYWYEFPGNGHWVTRSSGCALSMALNFWADPVAQPDTSCLASQPGLSFR